jgi:hypothetical protein
VARVPAAVCVALNGALLMLAGLLAGADEMGNMFQVYRDFEKEVLGARSIDVTRSLNPSLQTFDQWLAKNKSRISLA